MKKLRIPYIAGLERAKNIADLSDALKAGAEGKIDCVNWADKFPYAPECKFRAAWCDSGIAVMYVVRGLDLRGRALEDNGPVWEDSCCEFFVSDPNDGTYYNFELNCIGTLLAGKRRTREEKSHFAPEVMAGIKRFSTIDHKSIEHNNNEYGWSAGVIVPFSLTGIDPEKNRVIRGNFYKCGDKTAHPHFLSWSPIDTPEPNFHKPEFFGEIELV